MAEFRYRYLKSLPGFSRTLSGFTLLEVMIALAVMSIVLVSVYRMHSQSLTMNTAARFYTLAPLNWKPFHRRVSRTIQATSASNTRAIAGRLQ